MKNETKNKIIIIESIFLFIFLGFIIISGIIQGGKNRTYQNIVTELETGIEESRKINRDNITEIIQLRKLQYRSVKIIRKNGEIIRQLTDEVHKLGKANTTAIEIIDEIEELLSKIMVD